MNALFYAVVSPLAGAVVVLLAPKAYKEILSIISIMTALLCGIFVCGAVLENKVLYLHSPFTEYFSISFVADGFSVFMAIVSSFVALVIAVYSLEYMKGYENKGRFYFWMTLFVAAMTGLVFSNNLMLIYCFWEITALCSWRLIGFYRKENDIKAADRAFLTTFLGASLMLAGIVLIYIKYGTLELSFLRGVSMPNIAAFLLLAGILSKSAQLPFQTWLPDAGVAPTPVTALLHAAVLVKIGVYVYARLFNLTFSVTPVFTDTVVALSSLTIITAAGCALVENNFKRILAYSTVSQLGYIILAFALGGAGLSLQIGMLYILAHSLSKAGLFLCAGIVEHATGTKNINELGGLAKTMPVTAAAYLLCAFSIIGLPPTFGFWPKFMVILDVFKQGRVFTGILAVTAAVFTLFYLFRLFDKVFLGRVRINAGEHRRSPMVYAIVLLGVLSLVLGIAVKLPINFIAKLTG